MVRWKASRSLRLTGTTVFLGSVMATEVIVSRYRGRQTVENASNFFDGEQLAFSPFLKTP